MKNLRKILVLTLVVFFASAMFSSAFAVHSSSNDKITVYSSYGSKEIHYLELESYLQQGWSDVPVRLDNVTPLPTTFWETSYLGNEAFDLNEFIVDYEYIDSTDKIRIHYDISFDESGFIKLQFNCFNANGEFIKAFDFDRYAEYIDVPKDTATFSVVPVSSGGSIVSGQFYYCRQVDLYAADGRILTVYDVQAPLYEIHGWMKPVIMLADHGGVIEVPPHKVTEYEQVGWYTFETAVYKVLSDSVDEYIADKEYEDAIELALEGEEYFEGTKYEYDATLIREKAMDAWRNKTRCPIGYVYSETGTSYGIPYVDIALRNISYKKIIAFKVKFTCYDVFGAVEHTYYDYYQCTDADMGVCEAATITWDLDGAGRVHSIGNFRVTEVVFDDGTKWIRK